MSCRGECLFARFATLGNRKSEVRAQLYPGPSTAQAARTQSAQKGRLAPIEMTQRPLRRAAVEDLRGAWTVRVGLEMAFWGVRMVAGRDFLLNREREVGRAFFRG